MGRPATGADVLRGEARAIPRPSERRSSPGGHPEPGSTIDLRNPTSRTRSAGRQHDRDQRTAARSESDVAVGGEGFKASFHTLGGVCALGAGLAYGVLGLTGRADSTAGLVIAPLLAIVGSLMIARWIRPRLGPSLASVCVAGVGVRLAASVPRFLGGADSPIYQREGVRIAAELRSLNFGVDTGRSVPGTGTIRYLSGGVNVITGSNYITTFLLFAMVAFVGQCFFVMAMQRALNAKQFRFLCIAVMLSPTLAYWPSSIGKESLSLLGIGLGANGATLLYDRRWSGVGYVVLGAFAVGMVRPHVALILFAGICVGLLARRAHTRGRLLTHLALLSIVIVGAMFMAGASADLFGLESFDGVSDVNAALDFAQERTSQDAAQFVAWETTNAAAMISALESTTMIVLLLLALPGLARKASFLVQRGQLLFSIAFMSVFVFLFSAIGNFGILSRQRAQIMPFLLVLIAFGIGAEKYRAAGQS